MRVRAVAAAAVACGLPFGSGSGDIPPTSPAAATPAATDGPTQASTLVKKDTPVPPSATRRAEVKEMETPTPERWIIPNVEGRKLLFKYPDFFRKPQDSSGIIFLKPQFDDTQWDRIKDKTMNLSALKGGGCGISVIAAIYGHGVSSHGSGAGYNRC